MERMSNVPIPYFDDLPTPSSWSLASVLWTTLGWFVVIGNAISALFRDFWTLEKSIPLVSVYVDRSDIYKTEPQLTIQFTYINYSLFPFQISGIAGRVKFAGSELSGKVEATRSREIVYRREQVCVTVKCWISHNEAKMIANASEQNGSHHIELITSGLRLYAHRRKPPIGDRNELTMPTALQVRCGGGTWEVEHVVHALILQSV